MADIRLKYIGSLERYSELPVTGKQQVWLRNSSSAVPSADAVSLLATGLFEQCQTGLLTARQDLVTGAGVGEADAASAAALAASGFGGPLANGYRAVQFAGFDSSALTTYAQLIAYVDANIGTISGVSKTDRGLCSDGVNRIYEYRAGSGPFNVLITCGAHGPELAGIWAMVRWFAEFANPTDPTFHALRKMITVSWVPSANPSSFRGGRKNSNDVDLNRNYPFYWSRYTPPDADNNKGSAAFSEPETTAIKAIIDARGVDALIDCHNYEAGYSTYEILTAPGSIYTRTNRQQWLTAVQLFNAVYGANSWGFGTPGLPLVESGNLADANPTLCNWFTHYVKNTLNKPHGSCVLLECSRDMHGGTLTNMPAAGVTKYAGFITTWILTWLQSLNAAPVLPSYGWQLRRFNNVPGTSITAGGTLIDTAADTPVTWDESDPGVSVPRNYVDCPITCKGWLDVIWEGTIENLSAATGRFQVGITLDGGAVSNRSTESVTTPAATGDRTNFVCSARIPVTTVDAAYVPRIQATINKMTGASHDLKRSRITVRFLANDPRVNNQTPYF